MLSSSITSARGVKRFSTIWSLVVRDAKNSAIRRLELRNSEMLTCVIRYTVVAASIRAV